MLLELQQFVSCEVIDRVGASAVHQHRLRLVSSSVLNASKPLQVLLRPGIKYIAHRLRRLRVERYRNRIEVPRRYRCRHEVAVPRTTAAQSQFPTTCLVCGGMKRLDTPMRRSPDRLGPEPCAGHNRRQRLQVDA